jgi:hypothetical protein
LKGYLTVENAMERLNDGKEKRKYPRFFMDLPLEYKVMDLPYGHGGLVVNLSEIGLLIQSIKDIPVGTSLNIAVLFPKGFELANFDVSAEVVWKEICWKENWEGYQYGLKFIRIREEDHRKLRQLLSSDYELERASYNL